MSDELQEKEANTQEQPKSYEQLIAEKIQGVASQLGQDDWLRSQVKSQQRVPYPQRSPVIVPVEVNGEVAQLGKEGHPSMMSYRTMEFVRDNHLEVSKEVFKSFVKDDLKSRGFDLDLSYLDKLDEGEFRAWMSNVAEKLIHGNDAWGQTALGFLNAMNINLEDVSNGALTEE